MTRSMRGLARRILALGGLTVALLALSATEGRAQIFISGGYPVYGGTSIYSPFGGYSSYGSTTISGFGLGLGGIGPSYLSSYSLPGYTGYGYGYRYGGYPGYGYPGYGYGYGGYPAYGYSGYGYGYGYGFPGSVPGIGYGPTYRSAPVTSGGRGPGGYDSVVGGTYIPGFGVVGGLR